jgi:hypothetical protein
MSPNQYLISKKSFSTHFQLKFSSESQFKVNTTTVCQIEFKMHSTCDMFRLGPQFTAVSTCGEGSSHDENSS